MLREQRGKSVTGSKRMADNLLCCPFCSAPPRVYQTEYRIMCSSQSCPVRPSVFSNDLNVAEVRWNSRPEAEEEKAEREAQAKIDLDRALCGLAETATQIFCQHIWNEDCLKNGDYVCTKCGESR